MLLQFGTRRGRTMLFGWICCAVICATPTPLHADKLWYSSPAQAWTEALPVGNGFLGAMVFGGAGEERIQFNEHTIWTGQPRSYARPGAHRHLAKIRELLAAGRQKDAEALAMQEFMGEPLRQFAYQPLGEIRLRCAGVAASPYRRELDLDTGIATTQAGQQTQMVFASNPDRAVIVRREGAGLDCSVALTTPHAGHTMEASGTLIRLGGKPDNSVVRFAVRLEAQVEGGTLKAEGAELRIQGARAFTLVLTAATNVRSWKDVSGEPSAPQVKAVYPALRQRHLDDFVPVMRRVQFHLGTEEERIASGQLPTNERIRAFAAKADPALAALLFQYGRYLLFSSSRPGGQPANLQGIWNDQLKPSWDSKYTVNINTEMNYWPADLAALPETLEPLWTALFELAESGAITAREHYAAPGWVLHHNFDLWRGTAPINHANHGIWPTGGAWLSLHAWEHYQFARDRAFLARLYPVLKGAAEFFAHTLVREGSGQFLITSPSNSPEQGGLVAGPAMDRQIVRSLFAATAAAARTLGRDDEFAARLKELRGQIAPDRIGRWGQLQEWLEDIDDPANRHRHVSHLWALYPGAEIHAARTPELFAAARKSLEARGDEATGWSMGWKVNLWARLRDGDHSYTILRNLIRPAGARTAGLYPNVFDAHPPFQIDGNLGVAAGMVEMLVQSQEPGVLELLPALPSAWPEGQVRGIQARGRVTVNLQWKQGRLTSAVLQSPSAQTLTVHYDGQKRLVRLPAGREVRVKLGS
ncbi:MAG: glycoside hydrolase family 95 protein [Bryobacter sp.]|nr:glycoside hydrolase family 95 protein [Bryobacter sp.]